VFRVRRRTGEPPGRGRRRLKFLVDAQLPPALALWLRHQGHEAQHVQDVGLRDAEDGPIQTHALSASAVIVTKDEDYAARAALEPNGPRSSGCGSAMQPTACCSNGSAPGGRKW